MGLLRYHLGVGDSLVLGSSCRLGRHADCDLRIDDARVSGEHARLRWTGKGWELRDLGSRNGTFVGERRLAPGERWMLAEGSEFAIGSPEIRFSLVDGRPPAMSARHLQSRRSRQATGRLLLLPDDDQPEVSVFEAPDGTWRIEGADVARAAVDGEVVLVRGEAWQLDLGGGEGETLEASESAARVAEIALRFRVSRDEEQVDLTIIDGEREIVLPPRSYHYMLLTLARARIAARGAPPAERGWLEREELCRMLATDEYKLNVDICRARKQLAALGIPGAASVVERRPGTGRVRLGIERLDVGSRP